MSARPGGSATAILFIEAFTSIRRVLDVEFAQVLRRLVREGTLEPKRAEEAMEDLIALRVTRYAPVLLLERIWQLRQNLTVYDAAYVALAEALKAPLITRDQRVAAATGHAATIEVFW